VPRPTQVPPRSRIHFAYRAFTSSGRPSQCRSAMAPVSYSNVEALQPQTQYAWFGLFPFRSPLLRESLLISSPPGTEMVQFPGSRFTYLLYSVRDDRAFPRPGYPIRSSTDHGMFAPPRGFSQLTTTFFAE
jgi:hypothetical protein